MKLSYFRYSYRLSLTKTGLRKTGLWVSLGIGLALLAIDIWLQNRLFIPKAQSNSNNLKAVIGLLLLMFVLCLDAMSALKSAQRMADHRSTQTIESSPHLMRSKWKVMPAHLWHSWKVA